MIRKKIRLFLKAILEPPIDEYGAYNSILALKCVKEMDNFDDIGVLEKYLIQELECKFDLIDLIDILVYTGMSKTIENKLVKIGDDCYPSGLDRLDRIGRPKSYLRRLEEINEKERILKVAQINLDSKKYIATSKFKQPEINFEVNVRKKLTKALACACSNGAINVLGKALRDPVNSVSSLAVDALYRVGSDRAVDELVKGMDFFNFNRCLFNEPIEALGKIGSNRVAHALVRHILNHNKKGTADNSGTPLKSLDSLVPTNDREKHLRKIPSETDFDRAVDVLIHGLMEGRSLFDRYSSDMVLRLIVSNTSIDVLVEAIKIGNGSVAKKSSAARNFWIFYDQSFPSVREISANALCAIGSDKALDALVKLLEDSDPEIRRVSVSALGRMGSEKPLEVLIKLLMDDEDDWVRETAVEALGEIGSVTSEDTLIGLLQDDSNQIRAEAATALGKIGSKKSEKALINLLQNGEYWVRGIAAEALGKIGSIKSEDALMKSLGDEDEQVCRNAAVALCRIGSNKAADALIKLMGDGDEQVCRNAAVALMKLMDDSEDLVSCEFYENIHNIESEKEINALINCFVELDEKSRHKPARIIGKTDPKVAVNALVKIIEEDSDDFRIDAAADALGIIGTDDAVNALIEKLKDDDENCYHCAYSLGKIGTDKAIDALLTSWKMAVGIKKEILTDAFIQMGNPLKIISYFNDRDFNNFFRKYALKTKTPFYKNLGKWFYFDQKLNLEKVISSDDVRPE
ncbi:hypothetical protein DSCO28_12330 [Desulfosarcina ovata subsp. sediminis]|uniref:HEAT repeat-containing PBS lyase n=1 Tax=Desulfosarcina ovata subsp. sediminis TaxID=885957 RepID=A0A5K7ZL03_9BACT|nr:HEAT repeat domain-containing protein [Desulfosarcina ovata]BBO80667.1 hypothetical protein DSCO28_12330 [Desulfosarcina ovata subsp. sediminis]